MGIKYRLILMNFLQFFIWGSCLLTIGAYWFNNKHWSGTEFGIIFSTMGISSVFMPSFINFCIKNKISAKILLYSVTLPLLTIKLFF